MILLKYSKEATVTELDRALKDYIEQEGIDPSCFAEFQKSYTQGYALIRTTLEKLYPGKKISMQPSTDYVIGKPLYGMLGFTEETLGDFYEAANSILDQERYEDAADAFFFLVTLAPNVADFWLELGFCFARAQKYDKAIKAYTKGIELAPDRADSYLSCAGTYVRMDDFEQAQNTCDIGLQYAQKHVQEPWARELKGQLVEGKRQLDDLYTKSKYGTFSS
jgi:tetratricopeptide (TPR) repeat protein